MTKTSRTTRALLTAPTALAVVLGLGLSMPAQASTTRKSDPSNDFASNSPATDLARIELKTVPKQRIQITVGLHAPATNLARPSGIGVDFVKNKKTQRSVKISTVDGQLVADVCTYDLRQQVPEPTNCSPVPVTQLDATTYRAVVKLKQVKKGAKVLEWYASALDLNAGVAVDPMGPGFTKPYRWKL
jgi:hypothetical protein